ncbi:MAG TPA: pectate lyase [Fibrobacteria bacterium]|nr:pectate lyase [Fibrobacteria bacterium]
MYLHPSMASLSVCLMASTLQAAYTPPSVAVSALDKFRGYSELTTAAGSTDLDTYTSNLITWQMSHGGWSKAHADLYKSAWDGKADLSSWTGTKSEPLGMYDNNATVQEMRLLAVRYKATTNAANKTKFKDSFQKGIAFVLASALPNGGWPQVYPKRGNYSDMATYNDNAMVRLMVMVRDIVERKDPFDTDIATATQVSQLKATLDKGVQFALKAQIVNGGNPTVWCAQHDPSTYKAVGARAYELASKSGSESVGIVWFLMNWPDQTPEIQNAVKGAIAWFKKTKVTNLSYSSGTFTPTTNGALWYRFYEVDNDNYFFCDRDGASTKTQDITKISEERRTGYQWAGNYGSGLLSAESAYLDAIKNLSGTTTHPRATTRKAWAGVHSVFATGFPDGPVHITWLDANGRTLASVDAASREGLVEVPTPLSVGFGRASLVRIQAPDGTSLGAAMVR